MNDVFTLLCLHGVADSEGQPEFQDVSEFTSCSHALHNGKAFARRHANKQSAHAEIWLNRQELLWASNEPWRGTWEGPAAVGLYAVTFDDNYDPHYKMMTSKQQAA